MPKKKQSPKHRWLRRIGIGLVVCLAIIGVVIGFIAARNAIYQASLQPFYDTAGLDPRGELGSVVRQENFKTNLQNGTAYRILYRTERADGSRTFSSGMVFVPKQASSTPRPVLAWAHGTLGLGDQCAPSRTNSPGSGLAWLDDALAQGWVVTATDYSGFGTAGIQGYLIGKSESNDVLNSVRAARNMSQTNAGITVALWGHSQGGNSSLFAGYNAASYAPELQVVGTVASAPAAELLPLLSEQYHSTVAWVIGPIVADTWPAYNSSLKTQPILTKIGQLTYHQIAEQCIFQSGIGGLIRQKLGLRFFSNNPLAITSWRQMAAQQSAPYLPNGKPVLVVESTADTVVLPNTTALYITKACAINQNVASVWVNGVNHIQIPNKTYQQTISWISDRFAGKPAPSTCNQAPPVPPANSVDSQ